MCEVALFLQLVKRSQIACVEGLDACDASGREYRGVEADHAVLMGKPLGLLPRFKPMRCDANFDNFLGHAFARAFHFPDEEDLARGSVGKPDSRLQHGGAGMETDQRSFRRVGGLEPDDCAGNAQDGVPEGRRVSGVNNDHRLEGESDFARDVFHERRLVVGGERDVLDHCEGVHFNCRIGCGLGWRSRPQNPCINDSG